VEKKTKQREEKVFDNKELEGIAAIEKRRGGPWGERLDNGKKGKRQGIKTGEKRKDFREDQREMTKALKGRAKGDQTRKGG